MKPKTTRLDSLHPDPRNPQMAFAECCGIRGLLVYASLFASRLRKGQEAWIPQADLVYRFKKTGCNGATFRRMIETATAELSCSLVWTVPPSTVGEVSQLQRLLGTTITRNRTVNKRKYHHGDPVDVTSMDYPGAPSGKRVLLVDDVTTTGLTLSEIKTHLEARGIVAERLALGMFWRMLPAGFEVGTLKAQWDRFATADQWSVGDLSATDWSV